MLQAGLLVILNVGLLLAGGYVLTQGVRIAFRAPATEEVSTAAAPLELEPTAPFSEYESVATRNLFRVGPERAHERPKAAIPEPTEKLKESRLRIKLIGTGAAANPAYSLAVIVDEAKRETRVVRNNDQLTDSAKVARIERRRLVIENQGRFEEISLDDEPKTKKRGGKSAATSTHQRRRPKGLTIRPPTLTERVRGLTQDAAESTRSVAPPPAQSILTQARIVPRYGEGGELGGLEITAIRPGSLLEAAGLQNNDLVVGVNGTQLSDPADGLKVFRELATSQSFVLEVKRGTTVLSLPYSAETR
ncbi:MAG: type II secretion system protein N [Myxococcota bacterium]